MHALLTELRRRSAPRRWRQGKPDEALKYYRRALDITESSLGFKHPSYAMRLWRLGRFLREQGRLDEALESFQRSLSTVDATLKADDWRFSPEPLFAIVDIELEQQKFEDAREHVEIGVGNLEVSGDQPAALAWGRFLLAKVLWPERSRRSHARELAEQARDMLEQANSGLAQERLEQVQAWLEEHAAPRTR
jgi:tetratricopeptide (TPR) repeat protein